MAYCRFGEGSDIYLIEHTGGFLQCVGCSIEGPGANEFIFRRDAIRHLRVHESWGHKVPTYAVTRLEEELKHEGNEVGPPVPWQK